MKFKEYIQKGMAQAVPILITALFSAGISFLQVILTTYLGEHQLATDPVQTATLGASMRIALTSHVFTGRVV